MLAGRRHSRDRCSISEIIWFPGKPVLYLGPIGTECLRTHAERLARIQFDFYSQWFIVPVFVQSRFRMSPVLFWFTQRARRPERGPECRTNDREPSSGRVVGFVNGRLALFFRSCLMPRGGENEIIMLRGVQVCCWAIVRIECILQVPEHTFLSVRIEAISLQTKSQEPSQVEETTRVIFCTI